MPNSIKEPTRLKVLIRIMKTLGITLVSLVSLTVVSAVISSEYISMENVPDVDSQELDSNWAYYAPFYRYLGKRNNGRNIVDP